MSSHRNDIPERIFMTALLKHTGIALAILVPLAVYVSFARAETIDVPVDVPAPNSPSLDAQPIEMPSQQGIPTAVTEVDLEKYAGTWYEIARLPMYFQRQCASDVTATYKLNYTDSSSKGNNPKESKLSVPSVSVINACQKADGSVMQVEGIAVPANDSGSKLKVTFTPKWLRWLPVGRADYWILSLDAAASQTDSANNTVNKSAVSNNDSDAQYQHALVGTPNKKYLWILSRTPSLSDTHFDYYKNLAAQQGYDTSKLKITPHRNT